MLQALGVAPRHAALYEEALTHPSYANEVGLAFSNQRLEFLGDAVLQLVVSERLFRRYPNLPEGALTQRRAAVVCEEALVRAAERLALGRYLRLGRGEQNSGGRRRPSSLADAVEALIGAIYLDRGLARARAVTLEVLGPELDSVERGTQRRDYKTLLQEETQRRFAGADPAGRPEYTVVEQLGPDHERLFRVEVTLAGRVIGRGEGHSKKEAEQRAAEAAWQEFTRQGRIPYS